MFAGAPLTNSDKFGPSAGHVVVPPTNPCLPSETRGRRTRGRRWWQQKRVLFGRPIRRLAARSHARSGRERAGRGNNSGKFALDPISKLATNKTHVAALPYFFRSFRVMSRQFRRRRRRSQHRAGSHHEQQQQLRPQFSFSSTLVPPRGGRVELTEIRPIRPNQDIIIPTMVVMGTGIKFEVY